MSVKFYKDAAGKVYAEDTILDDISEMIRSETDEELSDKMVADLAVKMLAGWVEDGEYQEVVEESYNVTEQDFQDWVELKKDSKIVNHIEDMLDDIKHMADEAAYDEWPYLESDPDNDREVSWVYVDGDKLDIEEYIYWFHALEVDDFHTDYMLKQGFKGFKEMMEMLEDGVIGDGIEDFITKYYFTCIGNTSSGYYRYIKDLTVREVNNRHSVY